MNEADGRAEEHRRAGHVVGPAPAPQGGPLEDRPRAALVVAQRLGHGRGDPARRDRVDADAPVGPGDRQRLGQLRHPALAGAVGGHGPAAEEAEHRGEVDDAAPLAFQQGPAGEAHPQGAGEVDVDDAEEVGHVEFPAVPQEHARRVDQDVQAVEPAHEVPDGLLVRHVQGDGRERLAGLPERLDLGRGEPGDGDVAALGRQGQGDGPADPAGPPGDQRTPAGERRLHPHPHHCRGQTTPIRIARAALMPRRAGAGRIRSPDAGQGRRPTPSGGRPRGPRSDDPRTGGCCGSVDAPPDQAPSTSPVFVPRRPRGVDRPGALSVGTIVEGRAASSEGHYTREAPKATGKPPGTRRPDTSRPSRRHMVVRLPPGIAFPNDDRVRCRDREARPLDGFRLECEIEVGLEGRDLTLKKASFFGASNRSASDPLEDRETTQAAFPRRVDGLPAHAMPAYLITTRMRLATPRTWRLSLMLPPCRSFCTGRSGSEGNQGYHRARSCRGTGVSLSSPSLRGRTTSCSGPVLACPSPSAIGGRRDLRSSGATFASSGIAGNRFGRFA